MTDMVTTNGAAILTIIVLWSALTWLATYMYMSEKISRLRYTIEVLDEYIIAVEENKNGDFSDLVDYYYSDGGWVRA